MKLTAKELLRHSFVITIDDERYNLFKQIFKASGISPLPKRFDGVVDSNNTGSFNCYLSHRNLILKAKEMDLPFVCVFEDDAYPRNNIMKELDILLDNIPHFCKVLSLGYIYSFHNASVPYLDSFYAPFYGYGAHSYVVFKEAYDDYIATLDELQIGDGVFVRNPSKKYALDHGSVVAPVRTLFIQYNHSKSNTNDIGYCLLTDVKYNDDGKVDTLIKKHPYDIFSMGFPLVEELLPSIFNIKKVDDEIVFSTVNAGTNTLTNITVKSILKFHPNAKVFVFDVVPKKRFTPIDQDIMKNVEVVKGIPWEKMKLPKIDISKATTITEEEKQEIASQFDNNTKLQILPVGDFHHSKNIQMMLDTFDTDFMLIDSDAPLNCPVHFLHDSECVTTTAVESQSYHDTRHLRPLVKPELPRCRYAPYIQYMNLKMLKENGIDYFKNDMFLKYLHLGSWLESKDNDNKPTVFYLTGLFLYEELRNKNLPVKHIDWNLYVNHLGQGTWGDKGERNRRFIESYKSLFKNKDALDGKCE